MSGQFRMSERAQIEAGRGWLRLLEIVGAILLLAVLCGAVALGWWLSEALS